MKRPSRLIGREYGFLEVISVPNNAIGEERKALCLCVCGNERLRTVRYLRSKTAFVKSCGCSRIRDGEKKAKPKVNFNIQDFYLGRLTMGDRHE